MRTQRKTAIGISVKLSANGTRAYRSIAVEHLDGVEWLSLARPKRLNAIHPRMATELSDYFAGLCERPEVRVVVLRGAGRAFCAGFDLDHVRDIVAGVSQSLRIQRGMSEIVPRMRRCPQPIIAIVHGPLVAAASHWLLPLMFAMRPKTPA